MRLSKLLNKDLPKNCDVMVTGLTLDSRQVKAGNAFVALKGSQANGKDFIQDALRHGAGAILVEAEANDEIRTLQSVPVIPVPELGKYLPEIAARFYGHPAKDLRIIGVTGTSGKTSCTHFIAQILHSMGIPCGIIGTLGSGLYGSLGEAGLTTPDTISLQKTLRSFVEQGAKAVAMEVSSHSIHQGRINGLEFDIGIYTNLSQDHLDYHGDMETYAQVKRSFLADFPVRDVIINADDRYGRLWINEINKHKYVYAYSINSPQPTFEKEGLSGISDQSLRSRFTYAENAELALHGIKADIASPWGKGKISLPLIGLFNLSNALAVVSALCVYGLPFRDVIHHFTRVKAVPGRMQTMGGSGHPLVVVDYAHKPDALEKVLQTLRQHVAGKIVCVFGCGGERDHGKRPLMAKIAEHGADKVIVTNDNPRHEVPDAIIADIMKGFAHPDRVIVEPDRSKAIGKSIQLAESDDCILVAGKGAELYQQVGDTKIPFDDTAQVMKFLHM